MKHRILLALILVCIAASAGLLLAETAKAADTKPDLIEINRIKTAVENGEDFTEFDFDSKYDFAAISTSAENYGTIIFSTKPLDGTLLSERINQAVLNYDTVLDFERDGIVAGKLIVFSGIELQGNKAARITAVVVPFSILCVLILLYYFYMRHYLYKPFKRLKGFATDVASGNLDIPLPMDRDNLFGEFSESFDILREELKAAREKAMLEEKSKKELVATLSHDIKTPISIIRAASELLEINETDGKKLVNIKAIQAKTLEMDTLITDLFSSALEDLSELKINFKDTGSDEVSQIIINADPLKKISLANAMPDCLIKADPLRLSQIFGNIISNSYKYAGTAIEASFEIADGFLKISFKDFGHSLAADDLPMLTNQYFRGGNAKEKQGAGLGLYICAKLLERMNGSLDFCLENGGLRADIGLALS